MIREYLLAACQNKRVYCIDLKSAGEILWDFPLTRPVNKPIVCVGNDVFVVNADNEMFKFDPETGLASSGRERFPEPFDPNRKRQWRNSSIRSRY